MTKITQLPVVSTMADQSVFVVVDNGVTKKLTYSALKTTLKGDKGETGETGAKGDTGAQGDKGDKGDTGAQGPVGPLAPFSTATDIRLGGIKIGTGVNVTGDGTLSVPIVTITTATTIDPGVVTPGSGLQLIGANAALTLNARLSRPAYKELRIVASAGNTSGYGIDGYTGSNPSVNGILPGSTVAFVIPNQPSHPLQIRTAPGGAAVTEGDWLWVSNTGTSVAGAGANFVGRYNGTLFWTVPDAPSQSLVYYQCVNHAGMLGSIAIKNDAQIIDGRITSGLGSVAQDILPDGNDTRNLGSASKRWNTLFVGPDSIDINGAQLTYSSGKIAASGGFELGKSIVKTNLTTAGSFRSAPSIKVTDATGSGFQATTSITPTAIDSLTYTVLDTTSTYWFRPADTVTVEFVGGDGTGAQASADMGLYIKAPVLSYNSPPTASLVFANQTTLNAQAQLQISDAQIVQRLADFLTYVSLTELRDGLPTFLDPQVNQTKALKYTDVDIPSGVITFDINLAFSTIPAGTYIFEVPQLVIPDGNYPLICETVQVGKLVASGAQYSWYLANRLDEGQFPNGTVEGNFVPVSCVALDNAGQPGYWYLSSNLDGTQKNFTEVLYGVRAVSLDNPGSNYTQAPTFNIKANGVTKVQGSSVLLASPVSDIDITSFGSSYTPAATVVLQGRHTGTLVTVPTSDANMWRVTTSFYPLSVTRTPSATIFVHNVDVTGSATPSNGQRVRNATTGVLLPGTIVSVSPVWNTSNVRLYQVNMSQSVTVANDDYISFGTYEAEITPEQRTAEPVLPATKTKLGTVIVGDGLNVANGTISWKLADVPATSKGQAGDQEGSLAASSSYIYYCIADYTNGVANIWKRVALTTQTW